MANCELGPYTDKLCDITSSDSTTHYFPEVFLFADNNFLDFFGMRMLNGDRKNIDKLINLRSYYHITGKHPGYKKFKHPQDGTPTDR